MFAGGPKPVPVLVCLDSIGFAIGPRLREGKPGPPPNVAKAMFPMFCAAAKKNSVKLSDRNEDVI